MAQLRCECNLVKYHKWLQNSLYQKTALNETLPLCNHTLRDQIQRGNGGGVERLANDRGTRTSHSAIRVPVSNVPHQEIGRQQSANIQFKGAEQLSLPKEIPTDQPSKNSKFFANRRLHAQNRPFQSLFSCSDGHGAQTILNDEVSRQILSDDVPTIRPCVGSADFRKTDKLGGELNAPGRDTSGRLFGRFFAGGSRSGHSVPPGLMGQGSSRSPRLASQCGKVDFETITKVRVSRDSLGHQKKCQIHQRSKARRNKKSDKKSNKIKEVQLVGRKKCARTSDFRSLCCRARQASLSLFSKGQQQDETLSRVKTLRPESRNSSRVSMVVGSSGNGNTDTPRSPNYLYHNGRFRNRMGCSGEWVEVERSLEPATEELALQQKRNVGSLPCAKHQQKCCREKDVPDPVRQQNRCSLYSERRRHQVLNFAQASQENFPTLQSAEDNTAGEIHSWSIQRNSGQSVTREGNARVVSGKASCGTDISTLGHSSNRPFCLGEVSCSSYLRNGESPGPKSLVCGRLHQDLEMEPGLGISPTLSNASGSKSLESGRRNVYNRVSTVGPGILESRLEIESHSSSDSNRRPESELVRLEHQRAPPENQGVSIGNLEGTGWARQIDAWPDEDRSLLVSSWRSSTLKTYNKAWLRWKSWAAGNRCNSTDPTAEQVARYLCFLHRSEKLAPATILVHKSVVCTFANPLKSEALATDPLVRHVLKGISISREKSVKKRTIWNLDFILAWVEQRNVAEDSLYDVSRHVALLLLLHSGRRLHDLTLLRMSSEGLEFSSDCKFLTFWPEFGSKSDSSLHRQSGWLIKSNEVKIFDLIYWIKRLISVSESRRSARDNLNSLFITTRGRVREASRTVIGGWIKRSFKDANLNASPGSIRAAVANDNFTVRNLDIDDVIRKGNWRCKETFLTHYFKEIVQPSSSLAISDRPSDYFRAI